MKSRAAPNAAPDRLAAPARCRAGAALDAGEKARIFADLLADPSVLLPFILIGFAAQMIDGALGMAFGQISSTLLITMGVPPAAASAGVHTAETFTTGVSGISHVAHRNVDWRLFFRIVIPGVIGGVLGAYVLTQINADAAKPDRADLSHRARPLPVLSRRHAPPYRAAAEDRRAAGAGRRLPRCRRRRRLGRDRHLQPARPGQQPAQDHRHGQHRRILPHRDDLERPSSPRSAGRPSPWRPSAC